MLLVVVSFFSWLRTGGESELCLRKGQGSTKREKKPSFSKDHFVRREAKKKEPRKEEKLTYPVPYGAIFRFPLSHQVI